MKIRILIVCTVLVIGFTGTVFAEKEWYPGIGLEVSDKFHYDACGMWDNTICHPFEMTLSVTDSIDDMWSVLMTINRDGEEPLEIPMNISKNNAMLAGYPESHHSRTYANFYSETLAHLGVYSSFEDPSRLDKSPFGGQKWIGTTPAVVEPSEKLSTHYATVDAIPITWYHKGLKSAIWVSEEVPLPAKGEIFYPWNKTSATYQFELTRYVPNQNTCDVNNASEVRNALNEDPVVKQFLRLYPSATFDHIKTGDEPGNPRTFSEFRHDWFLLRVLVLTHDKHGVCYPVYGYTVSHDDPDSETEKMLFENTYTKSEVLDNVITAVKKLSNPSNQLKSGIPFDEIKCKTNLQKMTKHDGSPACVKEQSVPKLMERRWADIGYVTETDDTEDNILRYSPVLFKGTGVILEKNEFITEDFQKIQQRKADLERLLEDRNVSEKIRDDLKNEHDLIQYYSQQAFDEGIPFELVSVLWEKRMQVREFLSAHDREERFPIACSGGISVGFHAYSVDEKYVGKPAALIISVPEDHFTKPNLQKADSIIREQIGGEIDVVYNKSDCYAISLDEPPG